MVPAQERFDADDLHRTRVYHGLVPDAEFGFTQCARQIDFELHAAQRSRKHRTVVPAHRVAAFLLRLVHGGIGVLQQFIFGERIVGIDGHTDARRDHIVGAAQTVRCLKSALQFCDRRLKLIVARDFGENHDEFIAARACHRIRSARRLPQPLRHLAQQHVALRVTERVVDALEIVQVDEQHVELTLFAARQRDRLTQAVAQKPAVRQPGERVVIGQQLRRALRLNARRHVEHRPHAAHWLALAGAFDVAARAHVPDGSVGADDLMIEVVGAARP